MAPFRNGNFTKNAAGLNAMTATLSKEELLDKYLKEFRVEQCPLFLQHKCQQHRPFTCFHWHFQNQRRRRPVRMRDGTFNYSSDVYCPKYDETTGVCIDGDECPYLHRTAGDTERRYHLKYYKTGICVHDTDSRGFCVKNGPHCAFAHGPNELRPPLFDIRELQAIETGEMDPTIGLNMLDRERSFANDDPKWLDTTFVLANYKTEPCKKPPRLCRQGYACPQYHNAKDKRRSPKVFKYRSTPCPQVKSGDEWGDPSNCEHGDACQYCHTRTEQQFHPEIYKSTKCNDIQNTGYCPRGAFCAFAHVEQEPTMEGSMFPAMAAPAVRMRSNSKVGKNNVVNWVMAEQQPVLNEANGFVNQTMRNGSITPPFEENGVTSPLEMQPRRMDENHNAHPPLGSSIDSAATSSPLQMHKNRFLSGDQHLRRHLIDANPFGGRKASLLGDHSGLGLNNDGKSNGVFGSPVFIESVESIGCGLEDLGLDAVEGVGSKSRKSSGFSETLVENSKSRQCSGNDNGCKSRNSSGGSVRSHNNNENDQHGTHAHVPLNPQLGLFDLTTPMSPLTPSSSETSRLKEELSATRMRLASSDETVSRLQNACDLWKKEAMAANSRMEMMRKEKESAESRAMHIMQKESNNNNYLHGLKRVSELKQLPQAVLRSIEWQLRRDLQEVEKVLCEHGDQRQLPAALPGQDAFQPMTSDWSFGLIAGSTPPKPLFSSMVNP